MYRILRAVLLVFLAVILVSPLLSGCTAPCNYPEQRGVVVRILNAMPDMPVITVFINGKNFVQNYSYDPPTTCLYFTTYNDGSLLNAGDSQLFVATSDPLGKDTVATGKISLNFNRQTVIVMGRGHTKAPMRKTSRITRLDDQADQSNSSQTLIRFVNAIPDLDSLDVYFKSSLTGTPGKPDLIIHYGESTPHLFLQNDTGLTVTEAGHPNNIIFSFPYPFSQLHIFATSLVRGESQPLGTDFTASPLLLSDADCGNFLVPFKTFAVRLVNASRSLKLNMLIRSTTVSPENSNSPRSNYPNQQTVFNINEGTYSDYLPMNISLNNISGYWFSTSTDAKDTLVSSIDTARANFRYSKIAVEEDIFGSATPKISYLNLPDTMTNPSGNFGRVRIIDLSPDHPSIDVTVNGSIVTMHKKDVKFFDMAPGSQITLKDGATTKTVTIPVSLIRPISVYLLPEQSNTPALPFETSLD